MCINMPVVLMRKVNFESLGGFPRSQSWRATELGTNSEGPGSQSQSFGCTTQLGNASSALMGRSPSQSTPPDSQPPSWTCSRKVTSPRGLISDQPYITSFIPYKTPYKKVFFAPFCNKETRLAETKWLSQGHTVGRLSLKLCSFHQIIPLLKKKMRNPFEQTVSLMGIHHVFAIWGFVFQVCACLHTTCPGRYNPPTPKSLTQFRMCCLLSCQKEDLGWVSLQCSSYGCFCKA